MHVLPAYSTGDSYYEKEVGRKWEGSGKREVRSEKQQTGSGVPLGCRFGTQKFIIPKTLWTEYKEDKNSIPQCIGQSHIITTFSNMAPFPSCTCVRQTCWMCS